MQPCMMQPCSSRRTRSLHMDRRHSIVMQEGKERRNLGWVRTKGIYQYREFFTYYLLSHTHTHACPGNPAFLQAQKGHQSIIHRSVFPGSLKQIEVTLERTPSCSTNTMLCPRVGAGRVSSGALGLQTVPAAGLGPALRSLHQAFELALHFRPLPGGSKEQEVVGTGTGHT